MQAPYILEGLVLTVLAADASGMQGQWAAQLGLPFGLFAAMTFTVVPVIFIAVSIPPIRRRLGHLQHIVHIVALACIAIPYLTWYLQVSSIPLRHWPAVATSREINKQYNGKIVIIANSAVPRAYFPRSLDQIQVATAIFSIDPTLNPNHTEQGGVPNDR